MKYIIINDGPNMLDKVNGGDNVCNVDMRLYIKSNILNIYRNLWNQSKSEVPTILLIKRALYGLQKYNEKYSPSSHESRLCLFYLMCINNMVVIRHIHYDIVWFTDEIS